MAVMFGVVAACLMMMMLGMAGMAMRGMSMMRGLLMIAGLMVFGGLAVMFRRVLVMLGRFMMMLDALVLAHVSLPVWRLKACKT
jgi:hypothetical protein